MGDSKTANYSWPIDTATSITRHLAYIGAESPARIADNNQTVHSIKTIFEAGVNTASTIPTIILFDLGANDVEAMPTEADYISDYLERIDYARAHWPSVPIYIANAWRRNFAAECNTLANRNAQIIAARSNCFTGHDERVWMEGGDNGATMTIDGVHPSIAGNIEYTNQWLAILGL